MKTEIENAIKNLATRVDDEKEPVRAMQLAQAALSFAQTLATLRGIERLNES